MCEQAYQFTWRGIRIEVIYCPLKWGMSAHLQIRSIEPEGAPLPITETGYRSHFHTPGTVEANGGDVLAQVRAWLDEEAKSKRWRELDAASRQGEFWRS